MAGERRRQRFRALLTQAGVPDANVAAFEAAFVHESAASEGLAERSNERLEFLGDAILGHIVARSLYERYRDADEGELTLRKHALVSDASLTATAERLGFDELVLFGSSLARATPERRRSALGDAFEAFLAVLSREAGEAAATDFVLREHVLPFEAAGTGLEDPKTVLQEWLQGRGEPVPSYTDRFEGPDHERTFFAEVTVDGDLRAAGSGPTKKAAQRAAAAAALELIAERHGNLVARRFSEPSPVPANAKKPARKRTGRPNLQTKAEGASKRHRP
jgi:ribonuclease-3